MVASGVGIGKEFGDIYNDTNIPFLDVGGMLQDVCVFLHRRGGSSDLSESHYVLQAQTC